MSKIALVLAVALVCPLALASPGDEEEELKRLQGQIRELQHASEVAQEKGQHERARELAIKARQLEEQWAERIIHYHLEKAERLEKLGKHEEAQAYRQRARHFQEERRKRRDGGGRREKDELHSILEGLEHGIVALEKLGKREEVAHLKRIADGVRRRMRMSEGNRRELEIAEQRLEVFRLAFTAFREAEKKDAAELMEHAIHALELGIEGRRDEEARRIRETAPKLGAQVELLLYAGKLWAEFGHERKAEICTKMGHELQEIWRRKQRGKAEGLERNTKRVDELEERMKRIERALEEIEEMLRERRRR